MACGGAEVLGNYSSASRAASGAYRYLQRVGCVVGRPTTWAAVSPDADAFTLTRNGHEWQFQRTRWLVDGDGT